MTPPRIDVPEILLLLFLSLFVTTVQAQENEAVSDEAAEDAAERAAEIGNEPAIENITVTAQKREQTLQEVPAAVSALSSAQLEQSGINQIQDVALQVPNLHWGQENGSARITIRGVSNAAGTDQSTAFHIDGIYQNRAKALTSLTFFDVRRIEVLRGPQGTLYGRNATGGAINVISNPPSEEVELFGDIQFGNYNQILARGVLNLPIVDDLLAIRVSSYVEKRDGFTKNGFLDGPIDDPDDAEDFGLRAQLLWTPGEDWEITGRFNYFQKRGVGYSIKREGPLPDFVELPVLGPVDIFDGATPNPEDPRRLFLDATGTIDNNTLGGNVDAVWQSGDLPLLGETQLRAIASYQDYDDFAFSDQDHSDVFISTLKQPEKNREWVAELNWTSNEEDSDFGWLLGLFHLGAQGENTIDAPSQLLAFNVGVKQFFEAEVYSVAGFLSAWYDFTDTLRLEVGFRYSHDWKTSNAMHPESSLPILGGIILFSALVDDRSDDWGRPSGSLTVDYELEEGHLVYGKFSTGYKSGALNNDIPVLGGAIVGAPNADPEDIYSLEFGSKNRFFDDRLFANFTAFVYWYQDLQVSQLVQAQNFVQNAASARSFGFEVELTYRPWDPLTLTGQFAYLNTEFTDYTDCVDAKDLSIQDCSGNQLTRAPRFSGTFIAAYELDLARFGTLTPYAQVYASDEIFFRPTNEDADRQGAYTLLNFRLMWRSADERFGADFFIDNALDEDVATTKLVGSQLLGAPLLNAYDRPRTAGVRLSMAW